MVVLILLALIFAVIILPQVPLFYFLVGLGFLLSFIVYKDLWLLISGLLTIGAGVINWRYWLEKEYAEQNEDY